MAHERDADREALRALGDALRQTRQEHGIDVEQLAATTGISPDEIRAIEAGGTDLPYDLLWQLASALDTPPSQILRIAEHDDSEARSQRDSRTGK